MAYKQIKDADMKIGYEGGWCLKYVQDAFKTDHPYPTAIAAWNANYGKGNHSGVPPLGMTVPIYFTINGVPAGHVAIRLDDGYVASSTMAGVHKTPYYHKNIDDLIATYTRVYGGMKFLGWSEFVGTQRVVQQVAVVSADQVRQAYLDILERVADADGLAHYTSNGMTIEQVRNDLTTSKERAQLLAKKAAAVKAEAEAKAKADAAAKAQAAANEKAKQDAIDKQKATTDAAAQAQQNIVDTVIENNTLLKQIMALLKSIFNIK